jgi:hypothetical protein
MGFILKNSFQDQSGFLNLNVSGYDSDASSYFSTSGVTDPTAKTQINSFVVQVKALGLWSNMVSWPLINTQNGITSNITAYSLGGLGTYNAVLQNTGIAYTSSGLSKTSAGGVLYLGNSSVIANCQTSVFVYQASGSTGYSGLRPLVLGLCTNITNLGMQPLYSTDSTQLSVQFNRNSSIGYSSNYTLGSGRAFQPNFCVIDIGASNNTLLINNQSANVISLATTKTPIAANLDSYLAPNVGVYGTNGSAFGTYPFLALFNTDISPANMASLYTAYKTTIGSSLSLP